MFDDIVMGHDDLVRHTLDLADQLTVEEASDAFLASLSTRWLFLRPFLPSLVVARSMPLHGFEPTGQAGTRRSAVGPCGVCNTWCQPKVAIDRNVLNFERHKWGGVRHLDLPFIWFCLDRLRHEGGATPTDDDVVLFRSLVEDVRAALPSTSLTQAERLIRLPKSNKYERYVILETLSVISVLEDPTHPGFINGFVRTIDRQTPDRRFVDRGYPGEWWTSTNGVNDDAIAALFPRLA